MLLLLGTKSTEIKRGNFSGAICPKCREVSRFDYFVYSKYAYITLIPIFPVGKEAIVICNDCNEIIGQSGSNYTGDFTKEFTFGDIINNRVTPLPESLTDSSTDRKIRSTVFVVVRASTLLPGKSTDRIKIEADKTSGSKVVFQPKP